MSGARLLIVDGRHGLRHIARHALPDVLQPVIHALPLTALNDALRAVVLEGATLGAVGHEIALLAAWGIVPFGFALRLFKWF